MKTAQRRQNLKETIVAAAERSVETYGLAGLKARDLAAEAECSVGAIYNVVADLDHLILIVNQRTLAALEVELAAAVRELPDCDNEGAAGATAHLVCLGLAYLHFAAAHTKRWRAVFDHRWPEGTDIPGAYRDQQQRLFSFVERPLSVLRPDLTAEPLALLARSVFSAVHGIVILGLEEQLGTISLSDMEKQTEAVLTALGKGMSASQRDGIHGK